MPHVSKPAPFKVFVLSHLEEVLAFGVDGFIASSDFVFYHGLYHVDVNSALVHTITILVSSAKRAIDTTSDSLIHHHWFSFADGVVAT